MFIPKRIMVHHSATKDSGTVSWGAIWKFHVQVRGWQDIGYHAGVELLRDRYEALYGRPVTIKGAHTRGQNSDSLGICFIGDYDVEEPPTEMLLVGIRRVIIPWMDVHGIPIDEIFGHRSFSTKTCPGKLFSMEKLRQLIIDEKTRRIV